MKQLLLTALVFIGTMIVASDAMGQLWTRERNFIIAGIGPTGFLGDVGGANQIGTRGFRDFDYQTIRPALKLGYRYFLMYSLALKGTIASGMVSGNDQYTEEPFRNNRNLMFRSQIVEASVQTEWYFYTSGRPGARFRPQTRNIGWIGYRYRAYLFAGIGGVFFNPQGFFDQAHYATLQHRTITNPALLPETGWYNLRRLSTEGQGLPEFPTRQKYLPLSVTIPVGIGMTFSLSREWSIGAELGIRNTLTDYIDDISKTYVDPRVFAANFPNDPHRVALGEFFSNPTNYRLGLEPTMPGQQRGRPHHNDSYMFMFFTVQYKIISGPTSRRWTPTMRR